MNGPPQPYGAHPPAPAPQYAPPQYAASQYAPPQYAPPQYAASQQHAPVPQQYVQQHVQQRHSPQQYAPQQYAPPQPAVIDVGSAEGRRAGIAAALLIVLGLGALLLGVLEVVNGRMGAGAIVALGFGALLLILGLVPVVNSKRYFRDRRLIIDQAGIRWDDPKGKPWAMPWHDLAAVSISLHEKAGVPETTISGMLAGAAVDKALGKIVRVRLDLFPADPGVAGRHPEMAHLWEFYHLKNGYRQPLGSHANVIRHIEWAVSQFQPRVYRGVQRTRGSLGRY